MGRQLPSFGTFHIREVLVDDVFGGKGKHFLGLGNHFIYWANPKIVLFIFSFMVSCASFGQTSTVRYVRTEPNGVQVYESIGNEGVLKQDYSVPSSPAKREIEEFSLSECREAIHHIDSKIEVIKATPDGPERKEKLDTYEKGRKRVLDRIEVLTSNTH
jgi:hypothetical protein